MRTVTGVHVHQEIVAMIRRAQRAVVLISPFVRTWRELEAAVADAIARGVRVELIVRDGPDGPDEEALELFQRLEVEVKTVPRLHMKLYLSEREAIHATANLTGGSVAKAIESAIVVEREAEPDAWYELQEGWMRTLDERDRANPLDTLTADEVFAPNPRARLRSRADRGDAEARAAHRYCIVCRETAATDGETCVCRVCDAKSIANDEHVAKGSFCTRCGTSDARVSAEKPSCYPCYKEVREAESRRDLPTWLVSGRRRAFDVWWIPQDRGDLLGDPDRWRRAAIARRTPALGDDQCLGITLRTRRTDPLDLWALATPAFAKPDSLGTVHIERHQELPPTPDEPLTRPLEEAIHMTCRRTVEPTELPRWDPRQKLAEWSLELNPGAGRQPIDPAAIWHVACSPRRNFAPDVSMDPVRTVLRVEIELGAPRGLERQWIEAAGQVLPWMVAALHQHDPEEIADVFERRSTKLIDAIVQSLAGAAPLGPVPMERHPDGEIRSLGGRTDRIAAILLRRTETSPTKWRLKGSIHTARWIPIH